MLFAGAHDYSITNTTGKINSAFLLHHYGAGTLAMGATNGAITQYGTGKTILTGNNASDVGINIFGGTVQFSNNLQIGTNATAKVIALNNGTLLADTTGGNIALNSSGNFSRTVSLGAGGGTLDVIGGNKLTVSGVISDTAGQFPTLTIGSASSNGTIEFTAANTYTGATRISGGALTLTGSTQATNSISFTGGSLGLNTGVTVTAARATVNLTNGTIKVTGSTGAESYTLLSAASITGTPVLAAPVPGYALQVVDGVADELRLVKPVGGSGFAAWATTGTLGPVTFEGDTNGDGVQDGMAFLLGAMNPDDNACGRLPKVSESGGDLILTFNCLPIDARGTATLKVAHSTDLGTWTTTADVVPDADDAVPDNHVTFVVDTVSQAPLNKVTATINSVAAGGGGKLFGRVKGVTP
jgi:autotransporter-associated beta strand protein